MKKLVVLSTLTLVLSTPVLAQGRDPHSSSAASGNAEQQDKPTQNSAGGGSSSK